MTWKEALSKVESGEVLVHATGPLGEVVDAMCKRQFRRGFMWGAAVSIVAAALIVRFA